MNKVFLFRFSECHQVVFVVEGFARSEDLCWRLRKLFIGFDDRVIGLVRGFPLVFDSVPEASQILELYFLGLRLLFGLNR